jgi:uncharacterized protein DUF4123
MNPPASPPVSRESFTMALRSLLFREMPQSPGVQTFAILDGASVPDLLDHLYAHQRPEFICLYRGELEPDMAEVAPYLVRLEPEAPFTEWLLLQGWGRHWGIFARACADLKTMRRHLRGFLMVQDPLDQQLYFRYYDPRVLSLFLPTCDASQLRVVFGPIACFVCETNNGSEALLQRFDAEKLTGELIELRSGQARPLPEAAAPRDHGLAAESNGEARSLHMQIRQEQMDALAAPRRAQLRRKIVRYLRDECRKQVQGKDDAELEVFVLEQMRRAGCHSISIEWDLCRFCWLAALHGPRFDEECDWARNVLANTDQPGSERMDLLESYQLNYLEPMFNPG